MSDFSHGLLLTHFANVVSYKRVNKSTQNLRVCLLSFLCVCVGGLTVFSDL